MGQSIIDLGTNPNDGTGDKLRVGGAKINENFTELYNRQRYGVYNYDNSLAPIAIPATTWTPVTNDGVGASTFLGGGLTGVDIYDTTTNQFDYTGLDLYDTVDYRFDTNITTAANQSVSVRLLLSVGVANIPLTFVSQIFKTAGTYPLFGFIQSHLFADVVKDNPARFEVYTDAAATVDVNGWAVKAIKRKG